MPENRASLPLDKLSDLVAVLGGLVSVTYLSGYVNRWAYLRAFGAQWLLPQVSTASIVMASFFAIAPLYVLWSYAHFARSLSEEKDEKTLGRLLVAFVAIDVVLFLVSLNGRWGDMVRGALWYAAALFSLLSAAACAETLRRNNRKRAVISKAIALGLFLGFIMAPIQLGQGEAWWHASNDYHGMARVTVKNGNGTLPVLLATVERIYCLEKRGGVYHVRAVTWNDALYVRRIESYRQN